MKIVTIIGARPQFIKAAVVSRAFASCGEMEEVIVHTGQHYDANMSEVFFEEMCIPRPHYNLNINGLGHGAMTGQMLEKIEEVLIKEKPEWVELVENGFNLLAGSDHDRILQSVKELQEKGQACFENRLYGKGDAGEKVLKVLQTA